MIYTSSPASRYQPLRLGHVDAGVVRVGRPVEHHGDLLLAVGAVVGGRAAGDDPRREGDEREQGEQRTSGSSILRDRAFGRVTGIVDGMGRSMDRGDGDRRTGEVDGVVAPAASAGSTVGRQPRRRPATGRVDEQEQDGGEEAMIATATKIRSTR